MTKELLEIEIAKRDELIAELKAEILELKTESQTSAIEKASEIINDCINEDGTVDLDLLEDHSSYFAEITTYINTYILFHSDDDDYEDEEEIEE